MDINHSDAFATKLNSESISSKKNSSFKTDSSLRTPKTKHSVKNFWQTTDKFFILPTFTAFLTAFIILTVFAYFYPILPPRLPLFYSLTWGQAQLISKQQFFILPITLTLITLTNLFIAYHLHPTHKIIRRILLGNLLLISLIILIITIKILFIFI